MRAKLGELGTVITGNTPSKQELKYWASSDIPFIKPDVMNQDGITELQTANEYVSEIARSKARIVGKSVVLVTCIGTIGKVCLTGRECAFNQQINAIIPNDRVLPEYLAYCIYYNRPKLTELANAPVVPIINKRQFEDFSVNIEENVERQGSIVTILKEVDRLICYRRQQLQKLDKLVKARFIELFGTIHDNRFGFSVVTLQDVSAPIKDGTHQTPTYTTDAENGFKFLSSKDVTTGKVDWSHLKYIPEELHRELHARISPRKGDILLAKNGTTGIAAIVDRDEVFDIYVSLALIRPHGVDPTYLWAAINAAETKQQFDASLKGIGVPNLHLGEIKKAHIILPPMELQEQFAAFVEQTDKSKAAVQKALDETQLLFDSLMQKYFQ